MCAKIPIDRNGEKTYYNPAFCIQFKMSNFCHVSHKKVASGNNVSHANNKTKRTFRPNIHTKFLKSKALGRVRVTLSSAGMRIIAKHGGVDQYLLNQKISDPFLLRLKKRIKKSVLAQKLDS